MKNSKIRSFNHLTFTLLLGSLALACSSGGTDESVESADVTDKEKKATDKPDSADDEADKMKSNDETGQGGQGGEPALAEPNPSILNSFPADGQAGVLWNAVIEIEFDAPMDSMSVEDAYSSETLPREFTTFEWNEDETILRIIPHEDLKIATGSDPEDVVAFEYDYAIGTSARSAAGEQLDEQLFAQFTTVRGIATTLSGKGDLTGCVKSSNESFKTIWVGDSGQNVSEDDDTNAHYLAVVSFSLEDLGDDVVAFDKVELRLDQAVNAGAPYFQLKTPLNKSEGLELYDIEYSERTWSEVSEAELSKLGLLSSSAIPALSFDVSENVVADYDAQRLSQFVMRFTKTTNGNDKPDNMELSEPELNVLYYLP